MAQIHPSSPTEGQIEFDIPFLKADGSPGTIEPGSLVIALGDSGMGNLEVDEANQKVKVQHNGNAGITSMTGSADGDLGVGVATFTWSEQIEFMPPLGAVAGGFVAGPEGPIT